MAGWIQPAVLPPANLRGGKFGHCETLLTTDTMQFDDYSKYENTLFDPDAKQRRYREVFPEDEACAYKLGRRMTEPL